MRSEIVVKYSILKNLSKLYLGNINNLEAIESNINKQISNLNWKINEKDNIER